MFIDTVMNPKTSSPAERNVVGDGAREGLMFRLAGAKKMFGGRVAINITSLRDDEN